MDAEVVGAPDFGDGLHQLGVEVQAHAWEEEGRERESVKERWEGGSGQQVGEHTSLSNAAEETRSNATHLHQVLTNERGVNAIGGIGLQAGQQAFVRDVAGVGLQAGWGGQAAKVGARRHSM